MAAAGSLRPTGGGTLPSGSASEQYNTAFGLLKQADYPAAEEALRTFVQQHPNDPLAGNAQYWLGETYFARGKYADAASAFAEGYKRYPKGPKAADDLLKLGMSLGRANQKQNACVALIQLDHDFPHAGQPGQGPGGAEKKAARLLTRTGVRAADRSPSSARHSTRSAGFEDAPFLAVAVSGGPDSLALAILADRWARQRGGAICALTVDHGLRPESGAEMARCGGWLSARGDSPRSAGLGGAETRRPAFRRAARAARYRLLAEWCRDHGCLHLLDRASSRGPGRDPSDPRRARAAPPTGSPGCRRSASSPAAGCCGRCSAFGKARLTALLEAERQPFIIDPSNRNPVFERARLRGGGEPCGFGSPVLGDSIARPGAGRA